MVLNKVQSGTVFGHSVSQGVGNVMSSTLVPQEIVEWYLNLGALSPTRPVFWVELLLSLSHNTIIHKIIVIYPQR